MSTYRIAVCNKKNDKHYKNQEILWESLVNRNRNPIRTTETVAEYAKLSKAKKGELKDQGGFVGGWLKDGIRKNGYVTFRCLGTLDADTIACGVDFLSLVQKALEGFTYFIYSTHSHTKENQRYRIVFPFSREVTEEEYPAVMRMVAKQIGMDFFDDSTYQANRMMYWSSCPSNGDFYFFDALGDSLNPDLYLSKYSDWHDVSQWPLSSRVSELVTASCTKQQDPLTKEGIVGAFCRTYPITTAIEKFLSDVY
ncbi:MAG: hypothetical protein HUK24_05920, partial [Sphaerochaetaceae bacterium]|nr:hypothetical protein [Sphaerochaetaceae bacterium]